jgi:hypothetical protein
MPAKREYRDRADVEVAVLDALVDRGQEGMTVFEIRSHVDANIDRIEDALGSLKADGLIDVSHEGDRTLLYPADRVLPDPDESVEEGSLVDRIRDRLPL